MNLSEAREMATDLMREHGLRDVEDTNKFWNFEFDRGRRRFGYCDYKNRKISLSKILVRLNDETRVRNTILHEIAHALAGNNAHHGPVWRQMAIAIGCDGERLYGTSVQKPIAQWKAVCAKCGPLQYTYHRRRRLVHRICRTPLSYVLNVTQ